MNSGDNAPQKASTAQQLGAITLYPPTRASPRNNRAATMKQKPLSRKILVRTGIGTVRAHKAAVATRMPHADGIIKKLLTQKATGVAKIVEDGLLAATIAPIKPDECMTHTILAHG